MDPINPWIDPAETRRMAERLMLPAREPVATPEEAGFDDSFVGFSDMPPGEVEEAAPAETAAAVVAPVLDGDPEISGRWDWLRERFSASGFFLFDAGGSLVFDAAGHPALHFIARDFVRSDGRHSIRMRVRSNAVLELIPIKTEAGNLCLCVVVPTPLSQDAIAEIRHRWVAG